MQPLTKSEGTTSALGESHTMPMVVAKWRRSAGLWTRALGIGAVAGMRSMMPVALLAAAANRGGLPHIVSASTAV